MLTEPRLGPQIARHIVGFDLRRRPQLSPTFSLLALELPDFVPRCALPKRAARCCCSPGELPQSNSSYAQGGVAAVLAEQHRSAGDSIDLHARHHPGGRWSVDEWQHAASLPKGRID